MTDSWSTGANKFIKRGIPLGEQIGFIRPYWENEVEVGEGKNEMARVDVQDLWGVYPALKPVEADGSTVSEFGIVDNDVAEKFAAAISLAASAKRTKAAIDSLPKSVF